LILKKLVLSLILVCGQCLALDISNPLKLLAVADRSENIIDVVDVSRGKVLHRFETAYHPDQLLMTPYAPILLYTNMENRLAVFYSLETRQEISRVELPVTPRHVVLDTTGGKVGISDSGSGGFVLLSAYGQRIEFALETFPATGDVLFDPNGVDIYYSNSAAGSLGLLDSNVQRTEEMRLAVQPGQQLSSPSRSLDARYVYVANETTGEVYSLNAFSKIIYRTFEIGKAPARPYTTPQGSFLYMTDRESGRFLSLEQGQFTEFADVRFKRGVDLVTVGRFDRFNLFLSTQHSDFYIFDNVKKAVVSEGSFRGRPINAKGAADGKTAYVAFSDIAELAMINLEHQAVRYFPATKNGAGAFTIGLSNNVCH
jgi:DNA-binding beta-propeller fold protein YncE